jgi:hypothetical protein
MHIRISRITDNEAIEAFITGLRYHNNLRDKLLHKWAITVVDLLTTAKKYEEDSFHVAEAHDLSLHMAATTMEAKKTPQNQLEILELKAP